jgi:hypothetical protein
MSRTDYLRNNQLSADLTTAVAAALSGATVAGPSLLMATVSKCTLSARCTFLAQTTSLTLSALWEISDDGVNWRQARGLSNATPVAVATGTAGADVAVTRSIDAPLAVYGVRWARCSVLLGGANGAAGDQAAVSYDYADCYGDNG